MKKSAKLKRKTIKLIVKNLIVFVVLVAVASVAVTSWFNDDDAKKADAKGLTNVTCSVPEGMQVAVLPPNSSPVKSTVWHDETFSLDATSYPEIFSALSLTEITGDGISFIKPPLTQFSTVATPAISKSWGSNEIRTLANNEYLSFELYFRTAGDGYKVKLDEESYLGPPSSTQDYGNAVHGWSPNSVIGATRMSVIDAANTNRKLFWIPAPFLYFDGTTLFTDKTNTNNRLGLSYVDGESNVQTLHTDGTYNHGYYDSSKNRHVLYNNTIFTDTAPSGWVNEPNLVANSFSGLTIDYKLHKDVDIAQLNTTANYYPTTTSSSAVSYYTNHVRVNIWIEGEDPESRAAQVTGVFKTVLNLELVPDAT